MPASCTQVAKSTPKINHQPVCLFVSDTPCEENGAEMPF
jgi:hypothetical protein